MAFIHSSSAFCVGANATMKLPSVKKKKNITNNTSVSACLLPPLPPLPCWLSLVSKGLLRKPVFSTFNSWHATTYNFHKPPSLLPLKSPVSIWRGGAAGGCGEERQRHWWITLLIQCCRQRKRKLIEPWWELYQGARSFAAMNLLHALGRRGVLYICMICAWLWFRVKGKHRGPADFHDFFFLLTFFWHALW